jgi:hypothetical protein
MWFTISRALEGIEWDCQNEDGKLAETGKLVASQIYCVTTDEQATIFFDPCRSTSLYYSLRNRRLIILNYV